MVNVEIDISPIMALPENDVRSVIFNLIPQNEIVNLRRVCKTWNEEIQNNYEYDIKKLDEDSPNFKSILQLRIKNLEIQKLEITPVFNFDGTCIFNHPNIIRKLIIGEGAQVAQLNLQQLIGLVSKNLRGLHVNVTAKICNYQFPSDLSFNFKHLKLLLIDGATHSEKCEDNPRSLFHVLENSSYLNLKILRVYSSDIEMTLEAKSKFVGNVLRLISKQGKYLEEIFIDITPVSEFIELSVPLHEEELLRIKQIQSFKKLSLDLLPINSGIDTIWSEFLCSQKKLEQLKMYIFSPIYSVSLIQQITQNNSATLGMLEIYGLRLSPTDPPFDLSIFQNFPGLKTLKLRMEYEASIARANLPDVANVCYLPENLIELQLEDCDVLSDELLVAFRSNNTTAAKGFKKLQKLSLTNCYNQGLFGINAVVLYEIMMTPRPNLTKVDFSGGVHKEEASLKTVLNQLQLPDNTDFSWKKDSGELGWKNCVDN